MYNISDIKRKKLISFIKYYREWYCEEYDIDINNFRLYNKNDLHKFLSIFFLVSAVRGKDSELLNNFNNFYALPLIPTECEVYNFIKNGNLLTFKNNELKCSVELEKLLYDINDLDVKKDFEEIKSHNKELIKMCSYDLIDLCGKYSSYSILNDKNVKRKELGFETKSERMSNLQIQHDLKYLFL